MELPLTGGCQCGKIRYEITEAPQLVYTCHCTDCQRITGSAFSLGIALPETRGGAIRVRAGTLDDKSWPRPTRHIWTRSKQPWVEKEVGCHDNIRDDHIGLK